MQSTLGVAVACGVTFAAQAVAFLADEFFCHHRRGLPRWERIGHPLDTLTVIACFGYLTFVPWSVEALFPFLGLAAFSCFFVTKDEMVHAKECTPFEHWLHAVLFVLHPLVFAAGAWAWSEPALRSMVVGQFLVGWLILAYQLSYWLVRPALQARRARETGPKP